MTLQIEPRMTQLQRSQLVRLAIKMNEKGERELAVPDLVGTIKDAEERVCNGRTLK
jgi:hypothetical protein